MSWCPGRGRSRPEAAESPPRPRARDCPGAWRWGLVAEDRSTFYVFPPSLAVHAVRAASEALGDGLIPGSSGLPPAQKHDKLNPQGVAARRTSGLSGALSATEDAARV